MSVYSIFSGRIFEVLSRLTDIVYYILEKSRKDRKEESRKGWYHHVKVNMNNVFYKSIMYYKTLVFCFIRLFFSIMIRNDI